MPARHRIRTRRSPGPVVALTNEHAGSDGDIFSHGFKLMGIGPLVGTRTWGGVDRHLAAAHARRRQRDDAAGVLVLVQAMSAGASRITAPIRRSKSTTRRRMQCGAEGPPARDRARDRARIRVEHLQKAKPEFGARPNLARSGSHASMTGVRCPEVSRYGQTLPGGSKRETAAMSRMSITPLPSMSAVGEEARLGPCACRSTDRAIVRSPGNSPRRRALTSPIRPARRDRPTVTKQLVLPPVLPEPSVTRHGDGVDARVQVVVAQREIHPR